MKKTPPATRHDCDRHDRSERARHEVLIRRTSVRSGRRTHRRELKDGKTTPLSAATPSFTALLVCLGLFAAGVMIFGATRLARSGRRSAISRPIRIRGSVSLVVMGGVTLIGVAVAMAISLTSATVSDTAQAERARAVQVIGDAVADQLALTSLDVDPVGDTAGRPTLAEAPELALTLDPTVAPAVTGVGPDQGLRTYYVMFDNITGKVDFIRDER